MKVKGLIREASFWGFKRALMRLALTGIELTSVKIRRHNAALSKTLPRKASRMLFLSSNIL